MGVRILCKRGPGEPEAWISIEEAVRKAQKNCIEQDILKEFLEEKQCGGEGRDSGRVQSGAV